MRFLEAQSSNLGIRAEVMVLGRAVKPLKEPYNCLERDPQFIETAKCDNVILVRISCKPALYQPQTPLRVPSGPLCESQHGIIRPSSQTWCRPQSTPGRQRFGSAPSQDFCGLV